MSAGKLEIDPKLAEELTVKMRSKRWRLENLYYITDKSGQKIPFTLNEAQRQFLNDLHYRNVILKARQLGFTTFIQIFMLDAALFNDDVRCGVIAHNKEDAQVFFRDKIKFAFDNIPDWARPFVPKATKNDAGELLLSNNSSVRVGTSMRSGTLQYLHVSEYGKICRKYPDKAKEIRTGAFPAVHQGSFLFVESTAEGRDGDFFNICTKAEARRHSKKPYEKNEFKFHFYGWWQDPSYVQEVQTTPITEKLAGYFRKIQKENGITLTKQQMFWYAATQEAQGEEMKQEYPSTWEEAFEASIEGAYYARQMTYLRRNGRIGEVPWDPRFVVNTFWDLGMNDKMCIWFHQRISGVNRLIDYYENTDKGFDWYAGILAKKGYNYGAHYMPHDVNVRDLSAEGGKSRKQIAEQLGIKPIRKVKKPRNQEEILEGIEITRGFLMTCMIDETTCKDGISGLDAYRKEWDTKLGGYKKTALHDWASHPSDALRTGATGYREMVMKTSSELEPEVVEAY